MPHNRTLGLIAMLAALSLWLLAGYLLAGGRRAVRWRGDTIRRWPWAASVAAIGGMFFLQALPEFVAFPRHVMQAVRFGSVLCLPLSLLLQRYARTHAAR